MILKVIISISLYLLNFHIYSQYNQVSGNVWIFGDSLKVDFNQNPPSVDSDFKFSGTESCASVADCDGNLLFYTNGTQVFNKNQTLMPNGDGLMGDVSSAMGAMISPVLGNTHQFYLFVLDGVSSASLNGPKGKYDGLHYNIIDMSLDNGNGDIISSHKNIYLADSLGEKILGVRHDNGRDYWVVVRKDSVNEMYAFLVTPQGINTNPVISLVDNIADLYGGVGQMVVNGQRNKIAECVSLTSSTSTTKSGIIVYDFDASSGVISNATVYQGNGGNPIFYGCAFSPDDQQLFYSNSYISQSDAKILQHDMNAWTPTTMPIEHTIPSSFGAVLGHFKNRPDGKIYFSLFMSGTSSGYLHTIEDPNNSVNPNIQMNTLSLNQRYTIGLPNTYVHHYACSEEKAGQDHEICPYETVEIGCESCLSYPLDLLWEPSTKVMSPNDSITQTISLTADQKFSISMSDPCGFAFYKDSALVEVISSGCVKGNIFIPSAFSPNGDGFNDYFFIRNSEVKALDLNIYDRFGRNVFQTNDVQAKWDGSFKGKEMSTQVFVYKVNIEHNTGEKESFKGNVTLFR